MMRWVIIIMTQLCNIKKIQNSILCWINAILQASSLLKKTEGVVTLVVCNPRKDEVVTATDQKSADKPKQPEKPSKLDAIRSLKIYYVLFLLYIKLYKAIYKLFNFCCMITFLHTFAWIVVIIFFSVSNVLKIH